MHFRVGCSILTSVKQNRRSSGRGESPHWRYSPRPAEQAAEPVKLRYQPYSRDGRRCEYGSYCNAEVLVRPDYLRALFLCSESGPDRQDRSGPGRQDRSGSGRRDWPALVRRVPYMPAFAGGCLTGSATRRRPKTGAEDGDLPQCLYPEEGKKRWQRSLR